MDASHHAVSTSIARSRWNPARHSGKCHLFGSLVTSLAVLTSLTMAKPATGQAWGSINNFDCVNDTGVEAHGFDIEIDDTRTTDVSYTYDWNHYGVPKITDATVDPLHPRVLVRYASAKNPDGTWAAYTAIPAGPISPTQGHQFTDPTVNFGGEHFGVGFMNAPTAVRYYWLKDDGTGGLTRGPLVNVSTPVFNYSAPIPNVQPAIVVAVVIPPPPPALPPKQFGDAFWVKSIKTTSHNANKLHLNDLVGDDPGLPQPWANGEPDEVETEWSILQTDFSAPDGGAKGAVAGAPEELPGGDEVISRRYEFYKYTGPFDADSGEAMADAVGPDGTHGVGSVTYNDHIDPVTGEWVVITTDLSTIEVVGEFFGAQMSAFDAAPALGLIDHIQDGEVGVANADRSVVIPGGGPFLASIKSGALPNGLNLDQVTGILSGTPTAAGVFTFEVEAEDLSGALVSRAYTVTVAGDAAPATYSVTTSPSPGFGGTTSGDGPYLSGDQVTVVATPNPGYDFVNWTHDGTVMSGSATYNFAATANVNLVANFAVQSRKVSTSVSPANTGTSSGDNTYNYGDSVTVQASANAGYSFVNWTEGGVEVSASASYTFTVTADRVLVANFVRNYVIGTNSSPANGGGTTGAGTYTDGSDVTVLASPNAGYHFVNWTENGAVVSTTPSYSFTAGADRNLVANFELNVPDLVISSAVAAASAKGNKTTVTVAISNHGTASASGVTIAAKKDALLAGKQTAGQIPVVIGDVAVGANPTVVLTYNGVKAGVQTLRVTLTYAGGVVTRSIDVVVP